MTTILTWVLIAVILTLLLSICQRHSLSPKYKLQECDRSDQDVLHDYMCVLSEMSTDGDTKMLARRLLQLDDWKEDDYNTACRIIDNEAVLSNNVNK